MSLAVRQALVDPLNHRLIFQDETKQKPDLLNPSVTKSDLIALLMMITSYYPIEVTAVKSDHHDDGTGPGLHWCGGALDGWPLNSYKSGDYMDQNSAQFRSFLAKLAASPYCYDIGLGGSAYTPANLAACVGKGFQDAPVDHVHLGSLIDE